jgi:hypothetical protein
MEFVIYNPYRSVDSYILLKVVLNIRQHPSTQFLLKPFLQFYLIWVSKFSMMHWYTKVSKSTYITS